VPVYRLDMQDKNAAEIYSVKGIKVLNKSQV